MRAEEMTSSCTVGALDWICRKYSFNKEDLKLANRLPREMAESAPQKGLNVVCMWHLGSWLIGGVGSIKFAVGL